MNMNSNDIKKEEGLRMAGTVTIEVFKAGTKELLRRIVQKNLIMVSTGRGLDLLVQRLCGVTTYTATINYVAIGTSATAAAVSDTQLGAESARVLISTADDITFNQARIKAFFPDSTLSNTTYREVGSFVDGTASVNSGQIFNHAILATAYTKSAGTDTTIQIDIAFSQ